MRRASRHSLLSRPAVRQHLRDVALVASTKLAARGRNRKTPGRVLKTNGDGTDIDAWWPWHMPARRICSAWRRLVLPIYDRGEWEATHRNPRLRADHRIKP